MNQNEFDKLIKNCIEEDNMDKAWELYLEYEDMNPSLIEDYFIEKRNSYYICELISLEADNGDIDNFIDKIVATKDKEFIGEIALNNLISYEISGSNFLKLKNACQMDK